MEQRQDSRILPSETLHERRFKYSLFSKTPDHAFFDLFEVEFVPPSRRFCEMSSLRFRERFLFGWVPPRKDLEVQSQHEKQHLPSVKVGTVSRKIRPIAPPPTNGFCPPFPPPWLN